MAKKTLYMVLGVPDNESPQRIHVAFRDLAKRLHPDVAGDGSTRAFQEVAEAYAVLSDPVARQAYDRRLEPAERSRPGSVVARAPGPVTPRMRPSPMVTAAVPVLPAGLHVEVVLDADDILLGCVVPIQVPALVPCPQCGGRGHDWLVGCGYCRRQGVVETRELLRVRIPPLTASGTLFEVVLPDGGKGDLVVRLHVLHQDEVG